MKINAPVSSNVNFIADKVDSSANIKGDVNQIRVNPDANVVATSTTISLQAQSVQSSTGNDAIFDAKKVQALRNQIESGTFAFNTDNIANGLIASTVSMLQSSKQG